MTLQENAGAVRRFARAVKVANWLQKLPAKLTPPPFRLMEISTAFWQSRALYVAVQLDVATVLGDGRLAVEDIATQVSAHPDATYRLLRMLASLDVFTEVAPRVFCNSKLSNHLRRDHPKGVSDLILMHNCEELSRPWYEQLEAGVRTGEVPFELTFKEQLYAYMDGHGPFNALFSRAMDRVEALTGDSFVTEFDWSAFNRIFDIGGSKGGKSIAILKRHRHLTAVVVDRKAVVAGITRHLNELAEPGILSRITFQVGDALTSVPLASSDKDIYLLSAILHGFDDGTCVDILSNLRQACAKTGARIAVLDLVVPDHRADIISTTFDLQMFVGTRGRERTLTEWLVLFEKSGLMLEEEVGLRSIGKMLVLRVSHTQTLNVKGRSMGGP